MNPEFENRDPDKPIAYDANGQPLYAAPQVLNDDSNSAAAGHAAEARQQDSQPEEAKPIVTASPQQQARHNAQTGAPNAAKQRQSHITMAPESVKGHNYNPRMRMQYANEPVVVHEKRDVEIKPFEVSDEVKQRHEESRKTYPHLNLSDGEYVVLSIKRHPIGLFIPLIAGGVVVLAILAALIIYPAEPESFGLPSYGLILLVSTLVMMLVGIGTLIAVWVYLQNQFYMTNESVIQEIQHSLFSKREQTVSLGSIEDASYKQTGIVQTFFNYGMIRLSTEGEETTYRFAFVSNPRDQVAVLNNGVEAFKNGRPVDMHDT